jgi:hypothetical protein
VRCWAPLFRKKRGVVSTRVLYPNQRQSTIRGGSRVLSRLTGLAKKISETSIFDPLLNREIVLMTCAEDRRRIAEEQRPCCVHMNLRFEWPKVALESPFGYLRVMVAPNSTPEVAASRNEPEARR